MVWKMLKVVLYIPDLALLPLALLPLALSFLFYNILKGLTDGWEVQRRQFIKLQGWHFNLISIY